MSELINQLKAKIRDVENFPKEGITFKDITPVLQDADLTNKVLDFLVDRYKNAPIDAIVGIESRGFLFGMMLAGALKIPFVPVRKAGKLPYETINHTYDLEYGTATIEMHIDAISSNSNILIHDDLLATGGTAAASAHLVEKLGARVFGFSFLIELSFLNGKRPLTCFSSEIDAILTY